MTGRKPAPKQRLFPHTTGARLETTGAGDECHLEASRQKTPIDFGTTPRHLEVPCRPAWSPWTPAPTMEASPGHSPHRRKTVLLRRAIELRFETGEEPSWPRNLTGAPRRDTHALSRPGYRSPEGPLMRWFRSGRIPPPREEPGFRNQSLPNLMLDGLYPVPMALPWRAVGQRNPNVTR
jgi:hypothetical protein